MTDLIARLEAATADQQRELLLEAFDELYPQHLDTTVRARFIIMLDAEAYESAALTLVPEGWQVDKLAQGWRCGLWGCQLVPKPSHKTLERFDRGETIGYRTADAPNNGRYGIATPALAIVIAALRAREGV